MISRKQLSKLVVLTVLVCVVSACGGDPDEGKFLFRPEVGQSKKVLTKTVFSGDMSFGPMKVNINGGKDVEYTVTVASIAEDGTVTLDITYEDMDIDLAGGMAGGMPGMMGAGNQNFSLEELAPVNDTLEKLVGKTFQAKVSRLGKVVEVTGADEIASEFASGIELPEDEDMASDAEVADALKGVLGNDFMEAVFSLVFFETPDKKMELGEVWAPDVSAEAIAAEDDEVSADDIPVDMEISYTLREKLAGAAILDIAGSAKVNQDKLKKLMDSQMDEFAGQMPEGMGDMDIKVDLSGSITGEVDLNEMTGWINTRKMNGQVKGTYEIGGMMGAGSSMAFPVNITFKTSAEMFDK